MVFRTGPLGAALLALAWAGCALAATQPERERAAELKAVLDCRGVQDTAARLDCYDKAADALDKAESSGSVVVVDRKQAQAARRQAFGFSLPALSIFDRSAGKGADLNSIEATLDVASHDADGHWFLVLDDGAAWRQIDNTEVFPEPHKGSKIRIRRGSFGSYVMNIDGQPWIKVQRQR